MYFRYEERPRRVFPAAASEAGAIKLYAKFIRIARNVHTNG
jgi:hypothetical protein